MVLVRTDCVIDESVFIHRVMEQLIEIEWAMASLKMRAAFVWRQLHELWCSERILKRKGFQCVEKCIAQGTAGSSWGMVVENQSLSNLKDVGVTHCDLGELCGHVQALLIVMVCFRAGSRSGGKSCEWV